MPNTLAPEASTRERILAAVGFSILIPGLGHFVGERKGWAMFWFATCQITLVLGLILAGFSQLDYGRTFGFGETDLIFFLIPEGGNFLVTQLLARMYESMEYRGEYPDAFPLRNLGYILSGMSGVLAMFCAAHAAGQALAKGHPVRSDLVKKPITPGRAAVLTLLIPGLGHWKTGRKFKAILLGGSVLGLFLLGMALGDFADFNRQRHPYYWVGQMFMGVPGWLTSLVVSGRNFHAVLPYQDAGLLFTTSAGFFNVIVSLDAFHRAEHDWLSSGAKPKEVEA
ncbi:MAG: hypothetical protein COA70_00335 [Planctomycetota bacterium]|nr:MAG: hypothetical protein COA70_00335 [Planctomycetota bacterium]